ncbi:ninjurin-2 isoform X2 [Mastacembelus armatus]|uniref:ninjurin-2 isoform X2 n=1 Tax=Mastacembelus armatus TaxID=205130 RepID=UPI000E463FF5|nr:ninjurin-2-like isoform X2 [Mastacembelus armatus]
MTKTCVTLPQIHPAYIHSQFCFSLPARACIGSRHKFVRILSLYKGNVPQLVLLSFPDRDPKLEHAPDFSSLQLQTQTVSPGKVYQSMNINHYATKKSAAQSMLDVALLMANSSQLKTVLYVGPQYRFFIVLIVLLSLSIILQVVVGLLLVFIAKYDLNDVRKHRKLNTLNNVATLFVFFTVLINIFITALGFDGHPAMTSVPHVMGISKLQSHLTHQPSDHNTTSGI